MLERCFVRLSRSFSLSILRNPHLLLALTAFIWGGNAVAGKFAVGHVSPMVLTCFRWAIALALVMFFASPHLKRDFTAIKKHWLYLLLMGGVGYTVFNFFLYSALKFTSPINVTLEQSAMPMIIFVLTFLIYRVKVRWIQLAGYSLTVIGVLVVVSSGAPVAFISAGGEGLNRGDILMLGAALAYGGYSALLRSKPQLHWLSFLTCLIAAALLFSFIGVAFEFQFGDPLLPFTVQGWLVVLFAGIFPSLVSQGMFIQGVEKLGANTAGLYINLVPVSGALLSVLLLNETLHFYHAIAFVLVVGGITIAQRTVRSEPKTS